MNPIETVIELVSQETGITKDEMLSYRRTKGITRARHAAMILAYEMCPHVAMDDIGRAFRKDRYSVSYAAGRIKGKQPKAPDPELVERLRPRVREVIGDGGRAFKPPKAELPDKANNANEIIDLIFRQIQRQEKKLYEVEDKAGIPRLTLTRYRQNNGGAAIRKRPLMDVGLVEKVCRALGYRLQAVPIDQGPLTAAK